MCNAYFSCQRGCPHATDEHHWRTLDRGSNALKTPSQWKSLFNERKRANTPFIREIIPFLLTLITSGGCVGSGTLCVRSLSSKKPLLHQLIARQTGSQFCCAPPSFPGFHLLVLLPSPSIVVILGRDSKLVRKSIGMACACERERVTMS